MKIGFNWINYNDAIGLNPSFSVDDSTLSTPLSVNGIVPADIICSTVGKTILFNSAAPFSVFSVNDIAVRVISFKLSTNAIHLEKVTSWVYFMQLEVKGQKIIRKIVLG
ncbi:MAG: hypothetical protein ABIT08_12270 [Bacteroidia bacterium]